jgi:SAM-dependent methyltransferase
MGLFKFSNPVGWFDRLYLRFFYWRRMRHFDLPENQVGWRSRKNQELRFEALCEIGNLNGKSILDIGSGLGCFYAYLKARNWEGQYTGFDILRPMVKRASQRFPGVRFEKRDILEKPLSEKWDYTFISGVMNHKVRDNWAWIEKLVKKAFSLSKIGLGFNLLIDATPWKDSDLFYANPKVLEEKAKQWSKGNYKIVRGYLAEDMTAFLYH